MIPPFLPPHTAFRERTAGGFRGENPRSGLIWPAGGSESSSALQVLLDSFRNEEGENEVNSILVSPSPFHAPALGEAILLANIVAPEVAQQLPASPANPAGSWGAGPSNPYQNPNQQPGAAPEALPEAPAPAEVPHPDPQREALRREINTLVTQQLREECERGRVRPSPHFPEMINMYSEIANDILSHDLEISAEMDAETLHEWMEQIRVLPNLLKSLLAEYRYKKKEKVSSFTLFR